MLEHIIGEDIFKFFVQILLNVFICHNNGHIFPLSLCTKAQAMPELSVVSNLAKPIMWSSSGELGGEGPSSHSHQARWRIGDGAYLCLRHMRDKWWRQCDQQHTNNHNDDVDDDDQELQASLAINKTTLTV